MVNGQVLEPSYGELLEVAQMLAVGKGLTARRRALELLVPYGHPWIPDEDDEPGSASA